MYMAKVRRGFSGWFKAVLPSLGVNYLKLTVFKYIDGNDLRVLALKDNQLDRKENTARVLEVSSEWRGGSGGTEKTTWCRGGASELSSVSSGRLWRRRAPPCLPWALSEPQVPPLWNVGLPHMISEVTFSSRILWAYLVGISKKISQERALLYLLT